jgi:DNA-binding CsgD family transcriptional regulator
VRPGQAHAEARVLSDREAQVVRLLSGLRVPLIARQLYLSPSTVRNQLSMVYRKLGGP